MSPLLCVAVMQYLSGMLVFLPCNPQGTLGVIITCASVKWGRCTQLPLFVLTVELLLQFISVTFFSRKLW